ncbi:MFS transporter [Geomonas propionica]|uniref:MFS transporter n=1 Tax=Geomonas propionica TaxID=2798582 RepID=A0ABS0YMK6_9BACT|nr:MFS transporter [Geomonas propionica]MBJ6799146.1 MFS transporter [Geomonas propionica]
MTSTSHNTATTLRQVLGLPVIVAALGYFVDIYDLVLFSIVRVPSLKGIGLAGQELIDQGVFLLNMQMAGMLLGGILWGILGDRKGRLKIMFGSIFIYSMANLANASVHSIEAYALLRLLAGVGLAGELGAGITLVSEVLHRSIRGYGTMIVATVGVSGAILANFVAKQFDWRTAFIIGGILGLMLLMLRLSVAESGMFKGMESRSMSKGNFLALFTSRDRFGRFLHSILIGLPSWFVVGVLITFSPEFAKVLNVQGAVNAGNAVMYCYLGLVAGDLASGVLSQVLKSRKKVVLLFLLITVAAVAVYFAAAGVSAGVFYAICCLLGFGIGYWAIFVTVAAEQFGTNLRATVATSVPNFVRGMTIPITMLFQVARKSLGIETGAIVVGVLTLVIALFSLSRLQETFHKDLDYFEEFI